MAPRPRRIAARKPQGLEASPARDLHMSESQADDCLKRRQEISVAGEQNESVILPAEGQVIRSTAMATSMPFSWDGWPGQER